MKKLILLVAVAVLASCPAYSRGLEPIDDNRYEDRRRNNTRDDGAKYESRSGTRYEYDLSKPGDRVRYEVDPAAQIRDEVNPRVQIDREMGVTGGGAVRD